MLDQSQNFTNAKLFPEEENLSVQVPLILSKAHAPQVV
jgi:hypothetical protein